MLSKELKTGIAVIFAVGIIYWGLGFLQGNNILSRGTKIHAIYKNAGGIQVSQPVTINGVNVGKVSQVGFMPDKSGRILVTMNITGTYPVPSNTIAEIRASGLLGDKEIVLILGQGSSMIENHDTLRASIEESLGDAINKEVLPVKIQTEKLLASLDTAVGVLSGFLQGDFQSELYSSVSNVNQSLLNLNKITLELRLYLTENREDLSAITGNMNTLSKMIADNRSEFNRIMENMAGASDTLVASDMGKALKALAASAERLDRITASMEAGEGSLGKLIAHDSLYNNVNSSIESLDKLLEDLRQKPSRNLNFSVFGKKDKGPSN